MSPDDTSSQRSTRPRRPSFAEDFRRFFMRGLAAVLPTMITLWLLVWVWNFLWENLGRHIIMMFNSAQFAQMIRAGWYELGLRRWISPQPPAFIDYYWDPQNLSTRIVGVGLSILLVYVIGVFVGNLIGRTFWRIAERAVLRIPVVRAIYPAVKQVTDFVLADHSHQFQGSRVVACQPHEQNIWSIGLVTGSGEWSLTDRGPEEMVTVFIPSTPTSISGYVLVVPRNRVVELPMSVEEAMRLLVSGGVIMPGEGKTFGQLPPQQTAMDLSQAADSSRTRLGKVG